MIDDGRAHGVAVGLDAREFHLEGGRGGSASGANVFGGACTAVERVRVELCTNDGCFPFRLDALGFAVGVGFSFNLCSILQRQLVVRVGKYVAVGGEEADLFVEFGVGRGCRRSESGGHGGGGCCTTLIIACDLAQGGDEYCAATGHVTFQGDVLAVDQPGWIALDNDTVAVSRLGAGDNVADTGDLFAEHVESTRCTDDGAAVTGGVTQANDALHRF